MSLAYRNLIALDAKSGGGLLRSGRSGPNKTSALSAVMRGWHGAGAEMRGRDVQRHQAEYDSQMGRARRQYSVAKTHPKGSGRLVATLRTGDALLKASRAAPKLRRAKRKLAHEQRRLRHFGG